MKISLLVCFACLYVGHVFGQQVGRVLDSSTNSPIIHAQVQWGNEVVYTDEKGEFRMLIFHPNDSLQFVADGYEIMQLAVQLIKTPLIIKLKPKSIWIDEVEVTRATARKIDTISWRNEQKRRLQAKARLRKVKDVLIPRAYLGRNWNPQLASGSTATLVSLNLTKLIGLFKKTKQKNTTDDLLLDAETNKLIDLYFDEKHVQQLTKMSGDSLQYFMVKYRPQMQDLEDITEYHMLLYIKNKYLEFQSEGRPSN